MKVSVAVREIQYTTLDNDKINSTTSMTVCDLYLFRANSANVHYALLEVDILLRMGEDKYGSLDLGTRCWMNTTLARFWVIGRVSRAMKFTIGVIYHIRRNMYRGPLAESGSV